MRIVLHKKTVEKCIAFLDEMNKRDDIRNLILEQYKEVLTLQAALIHEVEFYNKMREHDKWSKSLNKKWSGIA